MGLERGGPPVVLVISGLDPTGGAGIQADIEAIASMGAHAAPLITAATAQDTCGIGACYPMDPMSLVEQARMLLDDVPVAACKIGLVPTASLAETIHSILVDHPDLPVVLDPVLASGAGDPMVGDGVREAHRALLLPLATVATPNSLEARALAPEADTLDAAAHSLLSLGTEYVLVTGTHEDTPEVVNILYGPTGRLDACRWTRLPHDYHGSGCTLASSVAGLLAHGHEPLGAVRQAQRYTHEALRYGYPVGKGQRLPDRFFWVRHPGR